MNEQVNKHVYLADMREKYFNEVCTIIKLIFKKTKASSTLSKEIKKFEDFVEQKKSVESNIVKKQELHIKSVMFERDNLQMELDQALSQIEKLQN
jgi:hypothetical protein